MQFPNNIRAAVWDKTDGCCTYCGIRLNPFKNFTIDHILPATKGGSDDLANLTPACWSCNSSKGTSNMDRFLQTPGMYSPPKYQEVSQGEALSMITVPQAGRVIGITESQMSAIIRRGEIQAYKANPRVNAPRYIYREDLEAWLSKAAA